MSNGPPPTLDVRRIAAEQTHALRHAVLRPHQWRDDLIFPGDELSSTLHLGAFAEGGPEPIGIATFAEQPMPDEPAPGDRRLRGMAVAPAWQKRGVGRLLISRAIEQLGQAGGRRVWCNARISALGFYETLGFTTHGETFDLPDVGPHVVMSIAIEHAAPRS